MKAARGEARAWFDQLLATDPAEFDDQCVEWPFAKTRGGYGRIGDETGRIVAVCHLVLEHFVGPRPPGCEAAHAPIRCHRRSCLNPHHLRWATHAENVADKRLDGTNTGTRRVYPNGYT